MELNPSLIFVTLSGIETQVRLVQKLNAAYPMLATPLPMVTLARFWQESNAPSPMLVTLSGIVRLVRLAVPKNEKSPMVVTGNPAIVLGIVTAPPGPV